MDLEKEATTKEGTPEYQEAKALTKAEAIKALESCESGFFVAIELGKKSQLIRHSTEEHLVNFLLHGFNNLKTSGKMAFLLHLKTNLDE
jgi:anti-sigma regulatory factor (Ser/Thr protein kinase)